MPFLKVVVTFIVRIAKIVFAFIIRAMSKASATDWIIAFSTVVSTFVGYSVYQISQHEWLAKTASVIILPSLSLMAPDGLFAASFVNTSDYPALKTVTDYAVFKCEKTGAFPEKYLDENFYSNKNSRKDDIFPGTISGRDSKNPSALLAFFNSDIEEMQKGKSEYYFVAQAIYEDELGHKKETRYCAKMGSLMHIDLKVPDLQSCPIFNCISEDCEKQTLPRAPAIQEQNCKEYKKEPIPLPLTSSTTVSSTVNKGK